MLFTVKGNPFFSIGGQTNNSSAYNRDTIMQAFNGIEAMGMNTIAAPIYWEQVETVPDNYIFDSIDMIVEEAKKRSLRVVLLWFGTWKNGASHYLPRWMKQDIETFTCCKNKSGLNTAIVSPFCKKTMERDAKAFEHVAAYVSKINHDETVLAIQVENEPGLLGTPRDYSKEANEAYFGKIPQDLAKWLQSSDKGTVFDIYKVNGCNADADWPTAFGFHAEELFSAYHTAKYVDYVAAKGKTVCNLPFYVNVWVRESQNRIPGIDYPSGGATTISFDIWKHFAPNIDCISPDMYFEDFETYDYLCSRYQRRNNPLYIPESKANGNNGRHILRMIENYELISVHCFAIDSVFNGMGELKPECLDFKDTVTILRSMKPLLEKYIGTGRIRSVAQYEGMDMEFLDFGDYYGRVYFFNSIKDEPYLHFDPYHNPPEYLEKKGIGLIIYEGDGSFYLAGRGFKLFLIPKTTAEEMSDIIHCYRILAGRNLSYLDVEEGRFNSDGNFIATRRRNGDETDTGLWVEPDIGVLHVQMNQWIGGIGK